MTTTTRGGRPAGSRFQSTVGPARPLWRCALPLAAVLLFTGLLVDAAWRFWPAPAAGVNRFAFLPPDGPCASSRSCGASRRRSAPRSDRR